MEKAPETPVAATAAAEETGCSVGNPTSFVNLKQQLQHHLALQTAAARGAATTDKVRVQADVVARGNGTTDRSQPVSSYGGTA